MMLEQLSRAQSHTVLNTVPADDIRSLTKSGYLYLKLASSCPFVLVLI